MAFGILAFGLRPLAITSSIMFYCEGPSQFPEKPEHRQNVLEAGREASSRFKEKIAKVIALFNQVVFFQQGTGPVSNVGTLPKESFGLLTELLPPPPVPPKDSYALVSQESCKVGATQLWRHIEAPPGGSRWYVIPFQQSLPQGTLSNLRH